MPRTKDEMHEQWVSKFAKRRTAREWAEFCAGMSQGGLERAFARCAEHAAEEERSRQRAEGE